MNPSKTDVDSGKLRFAGDVNVAEVTISSLISDKKFNVANQLITIQIFENLFSPFISGSIIFQESLDFAANFPFIGEEVVDIKIFTPTLDKAKGKDGIIEGRFYIYKMSDREPLAEKSVVYQLHFISLEAINDINVKLSKGFDGKISEIVPKLIKEDTALSSDKKLNVEETENKIKYVSNFWSPIKNINFLVDRAVSMKSSPTFIFFENRQGFNFVTLDSLNKAEPYQEFNYNNSQDVVTPGGGSKKDLTQDYKRITDLSIPTTYDYMDRVTSGAYGSQMLFADLTTKEYFNVKFSFLEDWGLDSKENRLNKFPITSNKVFATYRATMFNDSIETGLFTDYDDVSNARTRQKRISRLKQAESYKVNLIVAGRTDYTVGQTVKIKAFKAEPLKKSDSEEDMLDNIISGKYLVSAINHVIDREKHECHMELIKDSLSVNLDKAATK